MVGILAQAIVVQKAHPEISAQQRETGDVTQLVHNFILTLIIKKFQVVENFKA